MLLDDPMNIRGIQDIDEALYDEVMDVNIKAPFLCLSLSSRSWKKKVQALL